MAANNTLPLPAFAAGDRLKANDLQRMVDAIENMQSVAGVGQSTAPRSFRNIVHRPLTHGIEARTWEEGTKPWQNGNEDCQRNGVFGVLPIPTIAKEGCGHTQSVSYSCVRDLSTLLDNDCGMTAIDLVIQTDRLGQPVTATYEAVNPICTPANTLWDGEHDGYLRMRVATLDDNCLAVTDTGCCQCAAYRKIVRHNGALPLPVIPIDSPCGGCSGETVINELCGSMSMLTGVIGNSAGVRRLANRGGVILHETEVNAGIQSGHRLVEHCGTEELPPAETCVNDELPTQPPARWVNLASLEIAIKDMVVGEVPNNPEDAGCGSSTLTASFAGRTVLQAYQRNGWTSQFRFNPGRLRLAQVEEVGCYPSEPISCNYIPQ